MTPAARWLTPIGVVALTLVAGCKPSPERQAADAARSASQAAASPDQERLWQDAAQKGAPGLERVPILQEPVQRRLRPPTPQSKPAPTQSVTIPSGVQSQIRIVVYPTKPFESYEGPATATMVDQNNERIQLDLGPQRGTLTVIARAGGKPLPLTVGETVRVAYQARRSPQVPNDAIVIRTAAGAGIAHVTQGGYSPVQAVVPLFGLTARQLDDQPGSPVQITYGAGVPPVNLTTGQMAQIGDVTVLLLGSTGVGKGTDLGLIEGAPFVLNVLMWKVP